MFLDPKYMSDEDLTCRINELLNEKKRRRTKVLQQLEHLTMFLTDEQVTEVMAYINDNYILENN